MRAVVVYRNGAGTVAETDDGLVRIRGMKDYVDMWVALKTYFADRRGFDTIRQVKIPRTTHADVLQLAAIWDQGAAKARDDVFGVKGAKADWRAMSEQIHALDGDPGAVFADNDRFWHTSKRLAMHIQQAAEQPPDVDFLDELASNVESVPERLKAVGEWLVDEARALATGAADTAGDVAGGALSHSLGPLVKPLAIGAGVIGGAWLVTKAMDKRRTRRAG